MTATSARWPGRAMPSEVLDVAEFRDAEGRLKFRVSRYFSADGCRWVFHGPFVMFHPQGTSAIEGQYVDGLEEGIWRTNYEDGRPAAEGTYSRGHEHGYWTFWDRQGREERVVEYEYGKDVCEANGAPESSLE